MSEQRQQCVLCGIVPPDVFSLSCDHPLCLRCAASKTKRYESQYILACPFCQEETTFDQQLHTQLTSQLSLNETKKQRTPYQNHHPDDRSPQNQHNGQTISRDRYCTEHPEMELSYICKSCRNVLICADCAINGLHRHHDVSTIQEEGKRLKNTLQRELSSLTHRISDLKNLSSNRLISLQERKNQLQDLRYSIRQQYDDIRQRLRVEEKAILARCNQLILIHKEELQLFQGDITHQISNSQSKRQHITALLDPFFDQGETITNHNTFKLRTLNLITSYQQKVMTLEPSQQIQACYEERDQMVSKQIDNLMDELKKNKRAKFDVKVPKDLHTQPKDKVPRATRNIHPKKSINKADKKSWQVQTDYFSLV